MLGAQLSESEVEEMVRSADMGGDAKIGWTEFCLMMSDRLPVARVAWRSVRAFIEPSQSVNRALIEP
jgi:hypothetical protein